jgi:ABC-type uncharacterized transport system ATPase subunit
MANAVIILGKSGTGKSTSIKTLDPKETVIINVLGKRLPFKGSSSVYNAENKNLFQVDDFEKVQALLQNIDKSASHVKNIVIDDAIYIMRKEYFRRAKEPGYGKYTELAQHFQNIIQTIERMKPETNVFLLLHSEDVTSDNSTVGFKVSTVGSLLDKQYNPVEVVPTVLYSAVKFDDKGKPTYGFYTHKVMEGSVEIPAKSPDEMFTEDFIPNDLGAIVKVMNEYF